MPDLVDKATRFETYILGYLLGFGETVASVVKSTVPTLAYYNPLAANLSQKERKSIITWDISQ
jgi:hypothetical protein